MIGRAHQLMMEVLFIFNYRDIRRLTIKTFQQFFLLPITVIDVETKQQLWMWMKI